MEIASITPAIKIIKENSFPTCDIYISFGDNIRVTDIEGRLFTGIFLYMELGKGEDDDDLIVLDIGGENVKLQCLQIRNIEEI